jgi:predicted RNase H-like HicB family nuclease
MRKTIDPEQLRLMAFEGKTAPQIAKELGFSIGAVRTCGVANNINFTPAPKGRQVGFKVKRNLRPVHSEGGNFCNDGKKPGVVPGFAKMTLEHAEAEQKRLREIKANAGVAGGECISSKPTPVEALRLQIKLPWVNKVEVQTPKDLAPDLFDELIGYGNDRQAIADMFGFSQDGFNVWLKKYGYVAGDPEPARKPYDPSVQCRPGQSYKDRLNEVARESDASTASTEQDTMSAKTDSVTDQATVIQCDGYTIKIIPASEGGYVAMIPEYPGCITQGETMDEALDMVEDARLCWLEAKNEDCKTGENNSPKPEENIPNNIPTDAEAQMSITLTNARAGPEMKICDSEDFIKSMNSVQELLNSRYFAAQGVSDKERKELLSGWDPIQPKGIVVSMAIHCHNASLDSVKNLLRDMFSAEYHKKATISGCLRVTL